MHSVPKQIILRLLVGTLTITTPTHCFVSLQTNKLESTTQLSHSSTNNSFKRLQQPLLTLAATTDSNNDEINSKEENEAKALLDKVSRIRAEIAALEGKSIDDVEAEAKEKQSEKRQLKEEAAAASIQRQTSNDTKQSKSSRYSSAYSPDLPADNKGQVQQAAGAIERAFADGLTRQTILFALLPEGDSMTELQQWPGGAKQMSREAAVPISEALLREVRAESSADESKKMAGLPPKVQTQDIWEFDGSSIVTSVSSSGPSGDVQAMVLPNTDMKYVNDIKTMDEAMGDKRLFLLINPFWRNLDSWGFNLLAPNAQKIAQKNIFDRGFGNETYALNRLSVRGEICAALKVYPYDWQMFAFLEDEYYTNVEVPILLGSSKEEPSSKQFEELINELPEFKLSKNMRQMQRMMKK